MGFRAGGFGLSWGEGSGLSLGGLQAFAGRDLGFCGEDFGLSWRWEGDFGLSWGGIRGLVGRLS